MLKLLMPPLVEDSFAKIAEFCVQAPDVALDAAFDQLEREVLYELLQRHGRNQCRVAEVLGWHRNTLGREIARLKIQVGPRKAKS